MSRTSVRPRSTGLRSDDRVREGGRVVDDALLVAIAANERGEWEVVGCTVAAAELAASWTASLLRSASRVRWPRRRGGCGLYALIGRGYVRGDDNGPQ